MFIGVTGHRPAKIGGFNSNNPTRWRIRDWFLDRFRELQEQAADFYRLRAEVDRLKDELSRLHKLATDTTAELQEALKKLREARIRSWDVETALARLRGVCEELVDNQPGGGEVSIGLTDWNTLNEELAWQRFIAHAPNDFDPFAPLDQLPENIRRDMTTERGWARREKP